MQVELDEQLSKAGRVGDVGGMRSGLHQLVARDVPGGDSLPQPQEPVLYAFIYAVAMAELSRAALAPLPDIGMDVRLW